MDHIQAIAAVKDANMDLDLNLTTHLPNGEVQLTCIRPDVKPGRLLGMVKDLPWIPGNSQEEGYLALKRVLVFSASDGSMSLNIFTFGSNTAPVPDLENGNDVAKVGEHILEYAASVQRGEFFDSERDPQPNPVFEKDKLIEFMGRWEKKRLATMDPRRFLKQRELFEKVSGSDGMDVKIDVRTFLV